MTSSIARPRRRKWLPLHIHIMRLRAETAAAVRRLQAGRRAAATLPPASARTASLPGPCPAGVDVVRCLD